mgnify:CR=1 FL=1
MTEPFKEHDILICLPGFKAKSDQLPTSKSGGVGYKPGKLLKVKRIVYNSGENDVIWPYKDATKAVYRRAVRLATEEEARAYKA